MTTTVPRTPQRILRRATSTIRKNSFAYKLIAPALIAMLIVHFIPMGWGIYISFRDLSKYNIRDFSLTQFVGLRNYIQAMKTTDTDFVRSIWVTIRFVFFTVVFCYPLGLIAALTANRQFRGRTVFRGIMLIPLILPSVVSLTCLRFMLQRNGIVNHLLMELHLIKEPIIWLVGANTFWVIVIGNVWHRWPLYFTVFLSALQAIPQELYEAASIDGAGSWQRFRYITLPHLNGVTAITTLLICLWSFNNFMVPYIMLGGGYLAVPDPANLTSIGIWYNAFTKLSFSYAAAESVLMTLCSLAFTILYMRRAGFEEV
ncbi:MAG: sugar ABC transporter permease [Chloroflexota bacterium]|nr:sugar ABC transporter permease [Chloroflexota bacterium]